MAERLAKILEKLAEKEKLPSALDALESSADTTAKKDAESATPSTKRKIWRNRIQYNLIPLWLYTQSSRVYPS